MYICKKLIVSAFLFLCVASYINPHSLSADTNRFSNSFYNNLENADSNYYNYQTPGAPPYGYDYYGSAPEEPNSQIFPAQTQANDLYWGEVQQMEQE